MYMQNWTERFKKLTQQAKTEWVHSLSAAVLAYKASINVHLYAVCILCTIALTGISRNWQELTVVKKELDRR